MMVVPGHKILICPLDWGLGHATRDVEIIYRLLKQKKEVTIGADKAPLLFLRGQFPELAFIKMPSPKVRYPKKTPMALKMLLSSPKILWGIAKEHWQLRKIIKKHGIDTIISDNRYGLWNKRIHSVFITHQVWIKAPKKLHLIEPLINKINHWFINKYDECWIPDFEGENNLAGELSHPRKKPENCTYIGILSRFRLEQETRQALHPISEKKFDILAILSGPEPQRSIFEKILVKQVSKSNYKTLIVQGKPESANQATIKNIEFINHLPSNDLKHLIINANVIICRPGYSSIMDLAVLKKRAILVPTPGQTEQEYLAEYIGEEHWLHSVKQSDFELEQAISEMK